MGALCLSTTVLRRAPPHVRAPAPRKKPLSAPRVSALRQKTRHCPKPLTFSEMDIIIIKHTKSACLAQPVEHAAVNRSVGGSSPSTGAIGKKPQCGFFPFYRFFLDPPDAVIPHRKFFRRGPRLYPTENSFGGGPDLCPQNIRFAGTPAITPPKILSAGTPIYAPPKILSAGTPVLCPTKHTFCGDPGLMPSFLVTAENVFFNST